MILMVLKYYISKLEVGASDPVLFLLMQGGGPKFDKDALFYQT